MPIAVPQVEIRSVIQHKVRKDACLPSSPLAKRVSSDPLPTDVIVRIASHLAANDHRASVASLQRCSKELFFALAPILYDTLEIKPAHSDLFLTLGQPTVSDLDTELDLAQKEASIFSATRNALRRLAIFRYVRKMVIHALPSDRVSDAFFQSITSLPFSVFPSLDSVSLLANAVDDIRTWVPTSYDRPRNPAFLEALTRTSAPTKLCISFRALLSEHWEEHREATVPGQYQLVSRLNRLKDDGDGNGWRSLKSFSVHNIVHQVLPSLSNCKNVYHFSSHITGSIARPLLHPPGPESTYLPGPQWSYRSWQLGTAIKNLFPSGVDATKTLEGTSWEFVNTPGHVLTKLVRDDDDESGVGYEEVMDLVKGAVKAGLPQDLPMREGFAKELVGEVFEKIKYAEEEQCTACGHLTHSVPTLSSIRDVS
ncbi:hypothetical protein I316_04034 [Kwoniella heveanensis BCC8398]|uniref:Uncharacterized protein n=1 Tax=Kwoniella heveanensis BCC8398 TaxID=1296120 RepID=A0A1B9GSX5_9TREE|nr:hypothetical protein I316_04034 [Kwoniella heveanensis BCC8398]